MRVVLRMISFIQAPEVQRIPIGTIGLRRTTSVKQHPSDVVEHSSNNLIERKRSINLLLEGSI